MENSQKICSVCHKEVLPEYYFCPNCGNNLKASAMPVSVVVQIGLYALAILLPPLGLVPGIRYLAKTSRQAKWVGAITIILTLISSIITIWAIFKLFNSYMSEVNNMMLGL